MNKMNESFVLFLFIFCNTISWAIKINKTNQVGKKYKDCPGFFTKTRCYLQKVQHNYFFDIFYQFNGIDYQFGDFPETIEKFQIEYVIIVNHSWVRKIKKSYRVTPNPCKLITMNNSLYLKKSQMFQVFSFVKISVDSFVRVNGECFLLIQFQQISLHLQPFNVQPVMLIAIVNTVKR